MARRIAYRTPLKRFMDERGVDQITLSRQSGVPQATISRFITGKSIPSAVNLLMLARWAEVEPWELLDMPELAS